MIPTAKRTLPLLLIPALLLMSGCRKAADTPPSNPAAETADSTADSTANAAPDEPKLPKVDWWAPIAPIAARSYEGECKSLPDLKPAGPIVVGADGSVKQDAYHASLGHADVTLMRAMRNGGYTASLVAGENTDVLSIMDQGDAQPDQVQLIMGEKTVACTAAKNVMPLEGKSLFSVYAKLITVPSRKISCFKLGQVTKTSLDFQLQNDQLKLGGQSFDLTKAESETMLFKPTSGVTTAAYAVIEGQARRATVMYDEFGRLSDVQVTIDGGDSYGCSELNHAPD